MPHPAVQVANSSTTTQSSVNNNARLSLTGTYPVYLEQPGQQEPLSAGAAGCLQQVQEQQAQEQEAREQPQLQQQQQQAWQQNSGDLQHSRGGGWAPLPPSSTQPHAASGSSSSRAGSESGGAGNPYTLQQRLSNPMPAAHPPLAASADARHSGRAASSGKQQQISTARLRPAASHGEPHEHIINLWLILCGAALAPPGAASEHARIRGCTPPLQVCASTSVRPPQVHGTHVHARVCRPAPHLLLPPSPGPLSKVMLQPGGSFSRAMRAHAAAAPPPPASVFASGGKQAAAHAGSDQRGPAPAAAAPPLREGGARGGGLRSVSGMVAVEAHEGQGLEEEAWARACADGEAQCQQQQTEGGAPHLHMGSGATRSSPHLALDTHALLAQVGGGALWGWGMGVWV